MPIVSGGLIQIGDNGIPGQYARITTLRSVGGDVFIVTCGHAFTGDDDEVLLPETGALIARLERNLLHASPARDVAFARLTDRGLEALGYFDVRPITAPSGVVWSVRNGAADPDTDVLTISDGPFFPDGPYIVTKYQGQAPGDSGAPLFTGTSASSGLCGLLRGYALSGGRWRAYYTPLDGVL